MKILHGLVWILSKTNLSLLLFLLGGFVAYSQGFTADRKQFVKDCQRVFVEEDMGKNVNVVLPEWINSAALNESAFTKLVEACNSIQKKHEDYRATYYFLFSMVYQAKNKFPSEFKSEWIGLERTYRTEEESEAYLDFIFFSYKLFRYRALQETEIGRWIYKGDMAWNTSKGIGIQCNAGQLIGQLLDESGGDSIYIYETDGYFDYKTKKFVGKGGTITWEKAGLKKEETFAQLFGYKVDLRKMDFRADTVQLTTPYFKTPVLGSIKDRMEEVEEQGGKMPYFTSFDSRLRIQNLLPDIDFDGGFSLQGSDFVGIEVNGVPALLTFNYLNKPLFEISTALVNVQNELILSRNCKVKMKYPNGDSLIHSQCMMQFKPEDGMLFLFAEKKGNSVIPFVDYHFQISANAPLLKWKIKTPFPKFTYDFATAQEQKIAQFESINFINQKVVSKLSASGGSNPMVQIMSVFKKTKSESLPFGALATALGTTVQGIETQIFSLEAEGFLEVDSKNKRIFPTTKLVNYAAGITGEKDFDFLSFTSNLTPRALPYSKEAIEKDPSLKAVNQSVEFLNARFVRQDYFGVIDLTKDQLFLTGVDRVVLSEPQHTFIYPDSTFIVVKPKRDILFNGIINSGKFTATVREATFLYDKFSIRFSQAQKASFKVNPMRKEDGDTPIPLFNSFSNLTAELIIDEPTMKNGRSEKEDVYPKLLVPNQAKVLYNDKSIVKGAYDSTRFYYKLQPFEMDSLDEFDELSFRLKGSLISGGIFPELTEPLKIMNDYSLGFITAAPPEGLPFYGNFSTYKNKIFLSHNGLQGSGVINYETSTAVSKNLTFLPDSTIGLAQYTNLEKKDGIDVPSIASELAYISFQPKNQILKVASVRENRLKMFDNQCEMDGMVMLSLKGMKGDGVIYFPDANLESSVFTFKHDEINSDSSSFALKNRFVNEGQAPVAMETKNVKANVSMTARKGEFNSFGTKRIKFPPNQYYCTMDKFFWYMDKADVDFQKTGKQQTTFEAGADIEEPNFFSMHDDQDTLQFRSLFARYDLKLQTLFCNKVNYIRVGDAKIFPDSSKVIIRRYAVMDPLKNATIIAPYITKYHTFTNADVSITSRKKYEGKADYPYYDRDSTKTVLKMTSIRYANSVSQAEGEILQKDNFKLSKEFDYFGKVKIISATPGIYCDGSTRINHQCTNYDRSWMAFKDTLIAKNIQIPISESPVNDAGRRMAVGFLWKNSSAMDSVKVYPAFLSKIQGEDDPVVFKSFGYVQYNPVSATFQIASKNRLNDPLLNEDILTLYTESCALTGVGKIDLGVNLGELAVHGFGTIKYENESKKISSDLTLTVKFPMQKDVFDHVGTGLRALEEQKNADLKSKKVNFSQFAPFILPNEKMNDLFKDYEEDKLKRLPEGLDQTLVLTGCRFEYKQFKSKANETGYARGWVTKPLEGSTTTDQEGDEVKAKNTLMIIGMEGKPILKDVSGNIVITQTNLGQSNQGFLMNLKTAAGKEYVFDYGMNKKDGKLLIFSNEPTIKTLIEEMKPDKRKGKNFVFEWAEESAVQLAIQKMREFLNAK